MTRQSNSFKKTFNRIGKVDCIFCGAPKELIIINSPILLQRWRSEGAQLLSILK